MTKKIHNILNNNRFKQIDYDVYILITTFGEVILNKEEKINDRYRARDYFINKNGTSLTGKIYTTNAEYFENTLNRILKQFYLNEESNKGKQNVLPLSKSKPKVKVS